MALNFLKASNLRRLDLMQAVLVKQHCLVVMM